MNWSRNKAPKTIEVRTDKCQNYDLISSFYHYCALLMNTRTEITKIVQFLIVYLVG